MMISQSRDNAHEPSYVSPVYIRLVIYMLYNITHCNEYDSMLYTKHVSVQPPLAK